jgi:starch phosphorylase
MAPPSPLRSRMNGDATSDGRRDVASAIAELAERLPSGLAALAAIAYDYAWAWTPGAEALFRDVDPALWRQSGCNPRALLEATPRRRLHALTTDDGFTARLAAVVAALGETADPRPRTGRFSRDRPIAYFCSEFAVHCSLPLYGGGLGVLAGDLLKAAADLDVPIVGVGLLYRQGYFRQRLDPDGTQHEYWTTTAFERLPVVRVTDADGGPLTVGVALRGRDVRVQVWRADVGRVRLYLLDTDREDNDPIDRWITARLYIGDRHTRLAQYAVLGIGGVRALAALGIDPALVHLNEGHAALGAVERWHRLVAAGAAADVALARVRDSTIFTTHTPVAAGNEGYAAAEIEAVLAGYLDGLAVSRADVYALGRDARDHDARLSITPLALRTSRTSNAVSRRHGEVARAMWQPLWPEGAAADVPIGHVTNGVHTATWMAAPMRDLFTRHAGGAWRRRLGDADSWTAIDRVPDEELWRVRCELRAALVGYVRERSILDRLGRGEDRDYVEQAARVFDPDVLTIGFARRVATYKRLHLLTRFPHRGLALLANAGRPIQIVVAGKAHPQDGEAKAALRTVFGIKAAPPVGARVAFLEDYDLHMAPRIVAGVDLWLNLPRPPLEASGTSGMKVAVNGALNLSVLDGWWAEAYDGENGWAIAAGDGDGDADAQDDRDATALFDLLETQIIPLFYDRDAGGLPRGWLARIRHAFRTLGPAFTAERMLRDYVDTMYAAPPAPR